MKLLDVTAIQRGCVYDGSGVRTTIFLKDVYSHALGVAILKHYLLVHVIL